MRSLAFVLAAAAVVACGRAEPETGEALAATLPKSVGDFLMDVEVVDPEGGLIENAVRDLQKPSSEILMAFAVKLVGDRPRPEVGLRIHAIRIRGVPGDDLLEAMMENLMLGDRTGFEPPLVLGGKEVRPVRGASGEVAYVKGEVVYIASSEDPDVLEDALRQLP